MMSDNQKNANYKWEVLLLLWIAYLLNQGDRQAFNTVLPAIRSSMDLSDTSMGWIVSVFNLFFALAVPIGGWIGDRFSKKWVVTICVIVWSSSIMLAGLATSLASLIILISIATSGSQAIFAPANYSLIAQYHTDTRARAMAIHQTAYYIGVILAGWLAGLIADTIGWNLSFIIFGVAGIAWGVLMIFRLHDKPMPASIQNNKKPMLLEGFKTIFTTPTAMMLTIGFSAFIFVITGYMTWEPAHLQETFSQNQASAGFHSMFWTYAAAFVGILIAGPLSDKAAIRNKKARMNHQGLGMIGGSVFLYFMGSAQLLPTLYLCLIGWGFFRAFFDANIYTVLYDVTPENLHSSCSSAMIMIGFTAGSLAPVIIGSMKDTMGGLERVFPLLSGIWLICGLLMVITANFRFQKDYNRIHQE